MQKRWLWVVLGLVVAIVLVFVALFGIGAYFVMRDLEIQPATAESAHDQIGRARQKFAGQTPLIEVLDAKIGRIRVNRVPDGTPRRPIQQLQVMAWDADEQRLVRTTVPFWLARFGSLKFGMSERFGLERISVADIERHGPGLILDYTDPGGAMVLLWAE